MSEGWPIGAQGDAIDAGCCQLELDGRGLPFSIEDFDCNSSLKRELIHFAGDVKARERTGGYEENTWSGTMPVRQLLLLAKEVANQYPTNEPDGKVNILRALRRHRFSGTWACSPAGDTKRYSFELVSMVFDELPFKFDTKSKSDVKVSGTMMDLFATVEDA